MILIAAPLLEARLRTMSALRRCARNFTGPHVQDAFAQMDVLETLLKPGKELENLRATRKELERQRLEFEAGERKP